VARRAVFDTNILISGYLWKGQPRQAIEKVRDKEWTLLVSKDTIAELIRVLAYRKFGLSPEEIQPIVEDLLRISEIVEVTTKVTAIRADLTDNMFLALAVDGRAEVIVSGDHHLLDLRHFTGVPIIRVRRFLQL
jgi:putative PIN family toxin of toxin-antitoxin system